MKGGVILMQASDLVTRLAAGIERGGLDTVDGEAVVSDVEQVQAQILADFSPGVSELLILVISVGMLWGLWFRIRRGSAEEVGGWPNLVQFIRNGRNRTEALTELNEIDVLLSLIFISNEGIQQDWLQLTSSEKIVARSILDEKPANVIAEEMAVTVSHVYNIRSNIRRKWGVESNQELVAAIQRRIPS